MSSLKAEYGAMEYNNGKIYLNLNSYAGKGYIPVRKVNDIATVRVIGRDKLKGKGGLRSSDGVLKDIYIKHSSGEVEYITRNELVSKYKMLSGKHILMFKLKDEKSFYVKRNCNEEYRAMLLPPGFVNTFNGKVINGKAYVVAPLKNIDSTSDSNSEENEIDISKATIMSSELFKKSFVIPDNELIQSSRQKAIRYNNRFSLKSFINNKIKNKNIQKTVKSNLVKDNRNEKEIRKSLQEVIKQENREKEQDRIRQINNININQNINNTESKYEFKAEARLFNANNTLIGFMLVDKKGNKMAKDLSTVSKLASMHLISNISLVNSDNKTFLRGNGIRIEELPILKSR